MARAQQVVMSVLMAGLGVCSPGLSPAQSGELTIARNSSVFVDGKTFNLVPGTSSTEVAGLIDQLGARKLGPGALIFRSGDALYMVEAPPAPDDVESSRIRIEYVPPKNEEHQPIYQMVMDLHVLENVQRIFAPLRLPIPILVKIAGCDGVPNAWYQRVERQPTITLCYEYLQEIKRNIPPPMMERMKAASLSPADAVIGQFFYAVTHEMGHGLFDVLDVPVFGREEDAADQFAAYIMLRFRNDEARRFVKGAAYSYKKFVDDDRSKANVLVSLKEFSSDHGTPEQRFFNLLCMAYGADSVLFADVISEEMLPESRSKNCRYEFLVLSYAVDLQIHPHVDMRMARKVLDTTWFAETRASFDAE